jgi:NADH-quinone oxidoreductase subunit M
MMFFLLSNSGLPGTSGFVGEFMVLIASANESFIYATLASLTLVLAATYSLWLGKRVLFGKMSGAKISSMKKINPYEFWPLFILVVSIIIIGLKPGILLELSEQSSLNMIRIVTGGY